MTGKENLTSVTTGAPPSRHKFPSNKAASAQVTHNFSMQLAEGQTFPNVRDYFTLKHSVNSTILP